MAQITATRCHTHAGETVRPATEREMFRNGFGPTGEAVCCWCGDEAAEMVVFGVRLRDGQMAWSPAYCAEACHAEATGGGFKLL